TNGWAATGSTPVAAASVRIAAIVVAAGRGSRMQTSGAKAFLNLGGFPLVVHSLRTLNRLRALTSMVLVVAADEEQRATDIVQRYGPWASPLLIVRGGAQRQDSVAAGLTTVDADTDLVLVHDAARPFVSLRCVEACVAAAANTGAAIAAVAAHDTVKFADVDS